MSSWSFFDARLEEPRQCPENRNPEKHPESTSDGGYEGVEVVDVVLLRADDQVGAVADVDDPAVKLLFA